MPFSLHPYAAVKNGFVTRFIDSAKDVQEGEVALPVVADPDPVIGENERLWGPDFEVLPNRVRAYGRAVPLDPDELLRKRLEMLEAKLAVMEAKAV